MRDREGKEGRGVRDREGKEGREESAGERCGKSEGELGKAREGGGWAKIQRRRKGGGG